MSILLRRSLTTTAICAVILLCALQMFAQDNKQSKERGYEFFEKKIRPVLVQRCYQCHSNEAKRNGKLKGELLLDGRAGSRRGGKTGPAVVPFDVDASLLLKAVRHQGPKMPPDGKLSESVVGDFARWIEMGAPDPRDALPIQNSPSTETGEVTASRDLWSFQPVKRPSIPDVRDDTWPSGDLDRFVLSKLEQHGLSPAGAADRYSLLRRVNFDLLGLPPTPKEIESFLADASPDAFRRVVDRLLQSPHFGERWGRHWLDISGYADTMGIGRSVPAPLAWRYRDYVVKSFNDDKPYDQFVMEQLAGDLLPRKSVAQTAAQITATGFLAIGPWEIVNGDKVQLLMDVVDLQIDRIGQTMLGLTLGCARCHDHKFDPVPQTDYYALAGILKSTTTLNGRLVTVFSAVNLTDLPETPAQLRERAGEIERYEARLADLKRQHDEAITKRDELGRRIKELKASGASVANASTEGDDPGRGDSKGLDDTESEIKDREKELQQTQQQLDTLKTQLQILDYFIPAPPTAMSLAEMPEPEDCRINIRGNAHMLGDAVPRGVLSVGSLAKPRVIPGTSGRLELARWIADENNPLTARVFVNRVWHHLFGAGLVATVDNFGVRGERPGHPALLDYLAIRFVEQGWSVKKLIRDIVLSRTYQMKSDHNAKAIAKDPANRLLWRMNRRRLDAEAIRDAMLSISGQLNRSRGGPSLPLEIPGNVNFGDPDSIRDDSRMSDSVRFRRSVYLPVKRKRPFDALDILSVFDFPDPDEETGARSSTTIPTQSLYLLNSPFVKVRARAAAQRIVSADDDDTQRVRRLYLLALNRPATAAEVEQGAKFVTEFAEELRGQEPPPDKPHVEAWTRFCQAVLASNEFLFRE